MPQGLSNNLPSSCHGRLRSVKMSFPNKFWSEGVPKDTLTQAQNKSSTQNPKGGCGPQVVILHQVELGRIGKSKMHVYDGGILCIFDIGINFSVGSTHLRRIAAYTYASRNRCKSRSKDIQSNSI